MLNLFRISSSTGNLLQSHQMDEYTMERQRGPKQFSKHFTKLSLKYLIGSFLFPGDQRPQCQTGDSFCVKFPASNPNLDECYESRVSAATPAATFAVSVDAYPTPATTHTQHLCEANIDQLCLKCEH